MSLKTGSPLIVIITVVLNGGKSLEETILSVLNLSYCNVKHIVIDGGSTDETIDIILKYEKELFYWHSKRDRGIYDAMNEGWKLADLDSFVLFLGSGDKIMSLPDISTQASKDVLFGDVYIGPRLFVSKLGFKLKLGNTVHHQALMIKKRIHVEPPFSLEYRIYSDFDFNQRLYKRGIKFYKIKGFVSYASDGGVSAVRNDSEMLKIVRKNYGIVYMIIAKLYYFLQNAK